MHAFYIYNTASKKKEKFVPIKKDYAGIYSCGPTVYSTAQIGNFRTFTVSDLLVRTLKYLGFKIKFVMNITDVGHLVGDGDAGMDKVEKTAKELGISAPEVASKYTKEFLDDWKSLNMVEPDVRPKASEHIAEQIEIIKKLEKKGYTYQIPSDGVYFDTSKYKDYAKISHQDLDALKKGARVEENAGKKNFTDFALWKFSKSQEGKRLQEWQSPWGVGFPGWHIECSAMSSKYLGQPFDIHLGGEDHIFPHHPNEDAQSRCAYDTPLANYWVHVRFLNVRSKKMSKSSGNMYTVKDITNRGFEPLALRYYYMTSHYRTNTNFTWNSLEASQVGLNNLRKTLKRWKSEARGVAVPKELNDKFVEAISDDLNFPKALAVIWGLTKDSKYKSDQKKAAILKWDSVLGLRLVEYIEGGFKRKKKYIPKKVRALITKREKYRKQNRFDKADEMRGKILELGYVVDDTTHGPVVSKV